MTLYWLQQLLNAAQLASFYVPLAVAFALIQGITRRVFLSFGDLAMYASFAAIYACFAALLRGSGDAMAAVSALAIAIACGAALGWALARFVFGAELMKSALGFMIASIGLSIALQEGLRLQSMSRDIWIPPLFEGRALFVIEGGYNVKVTLMSAVALAVSILATSMVALVIKFSALGRNWRACAQSITLAKLCGVNTERTIMASFALASGLAAVPGWMSAISYGGTNSSIGLMMGFKAMFAAVVGGFGSVRGAVIGAIALAFLEVAWSAAFSTAYRDAGVLAIIVFILLLKPDGLAGIGGTRESETP
jgi:branched-chain amino acid transport system permease protein